MEEPKNISQALLKFQELVGSIAKDGKNPHFKSKYATLTALQEAIREPLQEAGLIVRQKPTAEGLETVVCHAESGECDAFVTPIVSASNTAQAYGSGITYARRYALGAYFNLIVDEDDDGAKASKQPRSDQSQPIQRKMTAGQRKGLLEQMQKGDFSKAEKALEYFRQAGGDHFNEFVADYTALKMDAQ